MNFEERLQQAVERGKRRAEQASAQQQAAALTEEQFKSLHSKLQLDLSNHIEECIKKLATHFPGFQSETIYGERGWGAACYRDDFNIRSGVRDNNYSRLEMTVRPYSKYHVLDLAAKGTISNKEVFVRKHYEELEQVNSATFSELVDVWALEYAELFAAAR